MSDRVLSVYLGEDRVGTLYDVEPIAFDYDEAWLGATDARPLASDIPLGGGRNDSPFVYAFFENLLPEGEQRKLIALRHHVSTVFGMLALIGGDAAGSISLLPPDQVPAAPQYQKTSWEAVGRLIHVTGEEMETGKSASQETLPQQRLSISGAQYKLLLSLDTDGTPMYPVGVTPSTHIVKPDILHLRAKLFATAINETLVMKAASLCQLPCAHVAYQPDIKACLVERYDRVPQPDGRLKKLWQADFCQLLGKPSGVKYEQDDGPTFAQCYLLLKNQSSRQGPDLRSLLRWLFFNLYVGNNDSHAKNLSLLATDEGLRLAPFYDLMSTRVYTGLSVNFAFSIGGEFAPGQIARSHVEDLAISLRIKPAYLLEIAMDMATAIDAAIPIAAAELLPIVNHTEKVLLDRMQHTIRDMTNKTAARIAGK
jgi:serine/threonine-protein kinase HipA